MIYFWGGRRSGNLTRKVSGVRYHPISALVSLSPILTTPCYPFLSPLATISLGLDFLTWWDDAGLNPEESESLITTPMVAAYVYLSIKLGKGITRDMPMDHLSTKHIPPLFKSSFITFYWFITSTTKAAPFLLCCSLCMRTLIWSGNNSLSLMFNETFVP